LGTNFLVFILFVKGLYFTNLVLSLGTGLKLIRKAGDPKLCRWDFWIKFQKGRETSREFKGVGKGLSINIYLFGCSELYLWYVAKQGFLSPSLLQGVWDGNYKEGRFSVY
jgi:hypothetical protein